MPLTAGLQEPCVTRRSAPRSIRLSDSLRLSLIAGLAVASLGATGASAQPEAATPAATPVSGIPATTEAELLADFIHYTRIARHDLAAASGQELLNRKMAGADFVALVEANDASRFDTAARQALRVGTLEPIAAALLNEYEAGRLARARNPEEVERNIALLSGALRGRLLGKARLIAAGEYAVPQLLNTLLDRQKAASHPEVQRVLIELGRQSIAPLTAALPGLSPAQQEVVADTLGQVNYRTSVPFLADLADTTTSDAVRVAARRALNRLGGAGGETANLLTDLAEGYYDEKSEVTSFPGEVHQLLWSFDAGAGLQMTAIQTPVFHEAMAMRLAERAMQIQNASGGVVPETAALWIASNFSREIDTPDGYINPAYPVGDAEGGRRGADYFGAAAGADVAQRVLMRAIDDKDTPLARRAIAAVEKTAGRGLLVTGPTGRSPLVEALGYPNRRVQFEAALAIGRSQPKEGFNGAERVVPTLAAAVRSAKEQTAAVLVRDAETYQSIRTTLESLGYAVLPQAANVAELASPLAEAAAVDIVVAQVSTVDAGRAMVDEVRGTSKLSATPLMLLAGQEQYIELGRRFGADATIEVRQTGLAAGTITRAINNLVESASGGTITSDEAQDYTTRALASLRDLAISGNTVLNASDASLPLTAALTEKEGDTKLAVAEILSNVDQDRAQRAIADAAFDAEGEERIELLNLVAASAKRFGNKLDDRQVSRIAQLAGEGTDAEATAAASLLGSLNVPNSRLLPLILGTK